MGGVRAFSAVLVVACLVLVLNPASSTLRQGLVALYVVFLGSLLGGSAIEALAARSALPLPSLLGMLLAGLALRNIPGVGPAIGEKVDGKTSAALRTAALVLILCRAGLGLDMAALRRLRAVVLRLAVLPCLCEAATVAALAHALLDFPAPWAALLGFTVAAVSPAVVVPSLLSLQERGFGVATGIPTLVVAAAALDDVFSIAGFGICLGFALPAAAEGGLLAGAITGSLADALRAPVELVLGLAAGGTSALLLNFVFPMTEAGTSDGNKPAEADEPLARTKLLLLLATVLAFGLKTLGLSGASALATLTFAAGVAQLWSGGGASGADVGKATVGAVGKTMGALWSGTAQPLLFGLLGGAVDLSTLTGRIVGRGAAILCVSGAVRMSVTALAVSGRGLRKQELLFCSLAWLPKATVQAAVGAVALDNARTALEVERGETVLAIAVLSIIATAPLGAVLIAIYGPKLLLKDGTANCGGGEGMGEGAPSSASSAVAVPAKEKSTV